MNTVKTVAITVLLMAVGYGVYVSLWQKPEKNTADKPSDSPAIPTVQMGSPSGSSSQVPRVSVRGSSTSLMSPTPGTLSSPAPLFGSNSRGGTPGASGNSVTLIPGPNGEKPPATPSIPAPALTPDSNLSPAAVSNSPANPGSLKEQEEFLAQYKSFIQSIQKMLDEGKLPEALNKLTAVYEFPNLPDLQRREVEHLLDQLAGTVIYSRQHCLEKPYIVQSGDTLDKIAERCGVPALLLARINGIEAQQLQPGQELKTLRGPFTAVVSLDKHELMLKLQGGYYAGRFPIGVGTDCLKLEGTYTVQEKTPRPIYHGPDGSSFSAEDGRNPLGKFWIGLGDRIGLHGTIDETGIGRDDNRGAICLKDRDIDDLFGILSVGSQVLIRR
jgi:hypothetical protein